MQTRSTTRKLANALAANSDVSNGCSAKNTPGQRSKIANSVKNSKSKDKVKVGDHKKSEEKKTVPADEMGVGLRKRRSQRLMTEEEKSVKNDKEVAEQSSSANSGEQRQATKKDAVSPPGLKKNKPIKRTNEDALEEVKRVEVEKVKEVNKGKKEKKGKEEMKGKKEIKSNKIKEETEEERKERKVKVEVTSKEEADADSRPPIAKRIKVEDVGEVSVSKVKSVELPSPESDGKTGTIKREVEPQMQLLEVKKDIKNEDQTSETEQLSRSVQSETKVDTCKKEENEEGKECGPTLETENKDSEPEAEESVPKGSEVSEKEAASTSAMKETDAPKAKETVLQGFDIRIEKLSDDFINSVRDKKLVIGGSKTEQKKDQKKKVKEPRKRKILDDKNFIPLNTSGATKFFVADMTVLKKSGINHPAVDVKRDLLYGPRIKRIPYSKVLAYNMKAECRKMRY